MKKVNLHTHKEESAKRKTSLGRQKKKKNQCEILVTLKLVFSIPSHFTHTVTTCACAPSHSCSFVGLAKAIERLLEGPERTRSPHPKLHLLLRDQLMRAVDEASPSFVLEYLITLSGFNAIS